MEFIAYVPKQGKHKPAKKQKAARKAEQGTDQNAITAQTSRRIRLTSGPAGGKSASSIQLSGFGQSDLVYLSLARNRLLSKYGGFAAPTFDAGASDKAVATADFMGTCVWPVVAGRAIASSWFQDFCTMPVLYHAQSAASSVYRDLMANQPTTIRSPRTSFHKLKAVQLVQDSIGALSSMTTGNVQKLIFAILILGSHEAAPRDFDDKHLPFRAYFPEASLINLWGRITPIEAHDHAAFSLIEKYGGLGCMQEPGLAPMATLVDILRAATHMRHPRFPLFFDAHVFNLSPNLMPALRDKDTYSSILPGRGFARISGGLPSAALSVFTQVACVDMLMNHLREKGCTDTEYGTMLNVRNATLHRLLSLPAWQRLPNQGRIFRTSYEVCRTTSVIYCNAVLFYIPPHTGWNGRLSSMLQGLLMEDGAKDWMSKNRDLCLWVFFVGALAAHDTSSQPFFSEALRDHIQSGDWSWDSVERDLSEYIWSEYACGGGARQLFEALSTGVTTPSQSAFSEATTT